MGSWLEVARRAAVLGGLAAVATGCPSGGTLENSECHGVDSCDGSGGGPAGTCDGPAVLAANCGTQFCHGGSTVMPASGGVELLTPPAGMTMGQSLYDRAATYPYASTLGCTNITPPELIIDGNDPGASLLLTKVVGTSPGVDFACGSRMPPSPTPRLSDADQACLTSWVNGVVARGGI